MLRIVFTFYLTVLATLIIFGQQGVIGDEYRLALDDLYQRGSMQEFDLRKKVSIERIFFRNSWLKGHIFYGEERRTTNEYDLKYDIWNKELLVNIVGNTYLVPMDNMKGFYLKEVKDDGDEIHHFVVDKYQKSRKSKSKEIIFELAVEGLYSLLINHKSELLKSNRVEALDFGNQNDKAIKKDIYFLRDKNGWIHKIPKRHKAAKKLFAKYEESSRYLKKQTIDFNDRKSLSGLISLMNK